VKGEPASQRPDLVFGLDEITCPELDAAGLLVPYTSPNISGVPGWIVQDLAPDHTCTPYEYGYLGVDYTNAFNNATGHLATQGDLFQNIASNATLAKNFLYENPQTDITGEELLAMQIEYYTQVLHQNWTSFWKAIAQSAPITDSWGDGFTQFQNGQDGMFVSYNTDPAYNVYFGYGNTFNTTVPYHAAKPYSWATIYGLGIVQGSVHNLTLAEKFLDWVLGPQVQNLVPTNEWEYPAIAGTPLPAAYGWALPPSSIQPLNQYLTPAETAQDLPDWQLQWLASVT
jgi:thiamine transport system substrate-binding protein